MGKLAVIVDGGFIRVALFNKTTNKPCGANEIYQKILSIVNTHFPSDQLFRIFYYDSIPDKHNTKKYKNPVDNSQVDFLGNIDIDFCIKLCDELKKKEHIAFRYGDLAYDGFSVKSPKTVITKVKAGGVIEPSDFQIKVTQKGVDLKIGLDIAWLSVKRIVDKLLIISGDSDLVPAFKFARKEGLNVYLAPLGRGVKPSMVEHSDKVIK
jgi:uncharacterized LabA/DUF88 family protein